MKRLLITAVCALSFSLSAHAADGLIQVPSSHSVSATADRLENILKTKGMTLFARIKHSESAAKVGIELRDTELVIFGNPKAGSPLMKCQQSVAIDLPQKALIAQDESGKVSISYNDPAWVAARHDIQGCKKPLAKISKALAGITKAAAAP